MFEFSQDHCCQTCLYSEDNGTRLCDADYQIWCDYAAESLAELGFSPVSRPLVNAEARCPHYEPDDDKFEACHGRPPEEMPLGRDDGAWPGVDYGMSL